MSKTYYFAKRGMIIEEQKSKHPKDPIQWGMNPPVLSDQIPGDDEIRDMRQKGTSVVLLTDRNDESGRLTPVDAKDAVKDGKVKQILIRSAQNYDWKGQKDQDEYRFPGKDAAPGYVQRDEEALMDDWAVHNDILDGKLYDYRVMDRNGKVQSISTMHGVPKSMIHRLEPTDCLGEFDGYSDLEQAYGIRMGTSRLNLELSGPELQENGTIDISARTRHADHPKYFQIVVNPSETQDASGKEQWAGLHLYRDGQECRLPENEKPLLSQAVERFTEDISYGGEFTGKSGKELLSDLQAHAVCPDFYSEKNKWQEIHRDGADRGQFVEQWFRSGHSLMNDYTGEVIVPDLDPKQGTIRGLYRMELETRDKTKIEAAARQYEDRYQRPLEDPCGTYVLSLRSPEHRNSAQYDRPKRIPARDIPKVSEQITSFPGRVRSGHGMTIQGMEDEDTRKINAHWGRDTLERLHPGSDPMERIIAPEHVDLHPENREQDNGQMSLFFDHSYEQDAEKENQKDHRKEHKRKKNPKPGGDDR